MSVYKIDKKIYFKNYRVSKYRIPVVKERPSKCLHVKSKSCKNTCVKIKSFGIRLLKQKQN